MKKRDMESESLAVENRKKREKMWDKTERRESVIHNGRRRREKGRVSKEELRWSVCVREEREREEGGGVSVRGRSERAREECERECVRYCHPVLSENSSGGRSNSSGWDTDALTRPRQ